MDNDMGIAKRGKYTFPKIWGIPDKTCVRRNVSTLEKYNQNDIATQIEKQSWADGQCSGLLDYPKDHRKYDSGQQGG